MHPFLFSREKEIQVMPITHVSVEVKTNKVSMLTAFGWVSTLNFNLEVPFETEEAEVPKLVADTLDRAFEFVPEGNWSNNEPYVETATLALDGTRRLISETPTDELNEAHHYELRSEDVLIYSIDITYTHGEW